MSKQEKVEEEFVGDPENKSLLFSLLKKMAEKRHGGPSLTLTEEMDAAIAPENLHAATRETDLPARPAPTPVSAPLPLIVFRKKWLEEKNQPAASTNLIADFSEEPIPDRLEAMLKEVGARVWSQLSRYKHQRDNYPKEQAQYSQSMAELVARPDDSIRLDIPIEPGLDGGVFAAFSPDALTAWCMLFPALGKGNAITRETLGDALEKAGILYGVLDEKLDQLLSRPLCLIEIARGQLPVNGEDGRLDECFPRTVGAPQFFENEQGSVNFKELKWLTHIEANTVIAYVIKPTEGTPGTDVRGKTLPAAPGRPLTTTLGSNVSLSEDGTKLVSKITGQITYRDGRFAVDNVVVIPGNVDLSTGNLNVRGNLIIRGNVLTGFSVSSTGDLTVEGLIEGSTVSAGGNIVVHKGMNGNLTGVISAGGSIHCKYVENASLRAVGDIYMESIVNCNVLCNGQVTVRSGRGAIIGGTVWAMRNIEATMIGNKAGRTTVLVIGVTELFRSEWARTELEYDRVLFEIQKYVNAGGNPKDLPSEDHAELEATAQALRLKMEEMRALEEWVGKGQILAGSMHPGAQVTIAGESKTFIEAVENCRVFAVPDGLKIGHQ